MRTPETAAAFARDLQAVDDMAAGWWSQDHIEHCRERELARHAAYDAAFDRMVAEVRAISPHNRDRARQMLERMGGPGFLSGTAGYHAMYRALWQMAVIRADVIFEHDRRYIAATHLPTKATA